MNDIAIILIVGGIVTAIFFGYYFNYNSDSKSRVKDLYAEGLDLLIAGKRKAAYHNFKEIIDKARNIFKDVKIFKPKSSRKESKENYIICKNLK